MNFKLISFALHVIVIAMTPTLIVVLGTSCKNGGGRARTHSLSVFVLVDFRNILSSKILRSVSKIALRRYDLEQEVLFEGVPFIRIFILEHIRAFAVSFKQCITNYVAN